MSKEIQKDRKLTETLIRRAPFARFLKEILITEMPEYLRIQHTAIEVLHIASEAFLVTMFEDANSCAIHARRVTVQAKDIRLVKALRKE